jgi:type 2 lantibiotic biosynthesis protein LanM
VEADVAFAHALQPLVDRAWARQEQVGAAASLTTSAAADLRRVLTYRLSDVASRPLGFLFSGGRTLVDVAFARLADGLPAGSSTIEYERFCQRMSNTGLSALLSEHPVVGRLLATVVAQWSETSSELLDRLSTDRTLIERTFGIPSDAPITSLASGLSDPHHGGRSVAIVTFGDDRQLVYKPRPVDIEFRFQEFVSNISSALPADTLCRLKVLPRPCYGYVEHVASRPTSGPEEMDAFYLNAGRVLAILYLLGATDCHWENMIAAGDQLFLVDAETLFEGTPAAAVKSPEAEARTWASHSIEQSVLRTGMLPTWISVGAARFIDVSTLGAPGSEELVVPGTGWCFTNTDDMVWGERRVEPSSPKCLPVSAGQSNPLSDHGEQLVAGFEEVLGALGRPDIRKRVRVGIEAFRGVRRRVVVRPTRTYAILQLDALEPDALRNADMRALCLERLARAYVGETTKPRTWPILTREIAAMEDLDIPYFEGIVGSPDLFVGSDVVVTDYYEQEGLRESLRRLDRLSDSERGWQIRLIRGCLAAHRLEMGASMSVSSRVAHTGSHDARDVANLIASDAIEDPSGQVTWLTLALLADATRVQLGLVPPGLYDGRAGIAAFFYDCGETKLAEAVLRPVLQLIDDPDEAQVSRFLRNIGLGMTGTGGLLRLFQYKSDSDGGAASCWTKRSLRIVAALGNELLTVDSACDLVSGISGIVAPIARLHANTPTEETGRVLKTVGGLLLERQTDAGGWVLAPGHPALVGLSHGASGIALALGEIAVALGGDRYADATQRALASIIRAIAA